MDGKQLMDSQQISDLVREKIDKLTGELHLNLEQTALLLRWLQSVEKSLRQQDALVNNLKGILEATK